ncbi:MAG: flavin reductase family protein [bacterium]|nr:MAG: flavin reductase family protein [bacterium]
MKKRTVKPSTYLSPVPAVLVTCQDKGGRPNILTVAWTGVVCSDPPMVSISLRPSRYSHGIIRESGEFVVNIPPVDIVRKVDQCGIVSGKRVEKFSEAGLTPVPAEKVSPPLIDECTICLECRVREIVPLGVHDMFLGEIVATHVAEEAFDSNGAIRMEIINPLGYSAVDRSYRAMGDALGSYGYSREEKPGRR